MMGHHGIAAAQAKATADQSQSKAHQRVWLRMHYFIHVLQRGRVICASHISVFETILGWRLITKIWLIIIISSNFIYIDVLASLCEIWDHFGLGSTSTRCMCRYGSDQITQCQLRQDSRYENALRVVLQQVAIRIHNHLATSAYVITSSRSSVVINSASYAHIKKELDRSMLVYAWWPCFV